MDLTTHARDLSDAELEARYAYLAAQSMAGTAAAHQPQPHEAAHAASDPDDEADHCQHGEGSGIVLWPMGVVLAGAVVSFIAWIAR